MINEELKAFSLPNLFLKTSRKRFDIVFSGRPVLDVNLANLVRSGRKQP
jgi:hypothetical protein